MRVERVGNATLYHARCEDVLPSIRGHDCLITDPPYEAEAHSDKRRSRINGVPVAKVLNFSAMDETTRTFVAETTAPWCQKWALVFCQAEAVTLWRDAFVKAGAKYKRAMVWCKPDSAPQFNGEGPAQGYESIVATWCGLGRSRWNGGGKRGFFICPQGGNRDSDHETEKPLSLMLDLVALFSETDDRILDPFMGSGTTGVACARLGRQFIGIECDAKHFDTACRRIETAYKQADLFVEPPAPKPEQPDIFEARYIAHGEEPADGETVHPLRGHHGHYARLAVSSSARGEAATPPRAVLEASGERPWTSK